MVNTRKGLNPGKEEKTMAEPFLAEIRIFPFGFPPVGWALCDGAQLPVKQQMVLYSLIG
ncbi:MAG TPA: tail fiber protein, partial [Geobacteraceae bacterium]